MHKGYRGHATSFDVFAMVSLSDLIQEKDARIQQEIASLNPNYALNVNETEFVEHLTSKSLFDVLVLDFDAKTVSDREEEIPAVSFPSLFYVQVGKSYAKQVITYHIPFSGDDGLLRCQPNTHLLWSPEGYISNGELCFDFINFSDNLDQIKAQADSLISNLQTQAQNVRNQVEAYNNSLQAKITQLFKTRKEQLLKQQNSLASLGVPIKVRDTTPQTFAAPAPELKRKIKLRPEASTAPFSPDPVLSDSVYQEILQMIHNIGKSFERLPSTYKDKGEEDLRDAFLVNVAPHIDASVTGETFNKRGKTDILIRFENSNLFVAECKFWKGPKLYLDTISQLLTYLTWRDSKAAVMIFVKNKEISDVLAKIKEVTPQHSNYLGFSTAVDESWFAYRFHLNGDPSREVKLAILVFHLPDSSEPVVTAS